ncbi:MAG: DUF5615 family PIN-like protein [Flavobacteriia bacterium]|nr:DUF5615 family PIN-like protein [Flavobacteriia bacterium]
MKYLIDAQLSYKIAKHLKKKGFDVVHTNELPNKEKSTDKEISLLGYQVRVQKLIYRIVYKKLTTKKVRSQRKNTTGVVLKYSYFLSGKNRVYIRKSIKELLILKILIF